MKRAFRLFTIVAACLMSVSAFAQTLTVAEIVGDPLTIHVGSDASFQVYNSAVPGTGQVFPSGCTDADMGVFARVNGTLVAPAFGSHPCGTATGRLGSYTPWTPLSISTVSGDGSGSAPFTVNVRVGGGGVILTMTVTYVNGQNFFRIRSNFSTNIPRQVTVFLGADIFLAASDAGVFFFEPTLNAPGGSDCQIPATYNILLIPITPAQFFTTAQYSNVWAQIGTGQLDDNTTPAGCIDNGAALQWDDVMHGQTTALISSAVSFGGIPPAAAFRGFTLVADPDFFSVVPGSVSTLTVTATHNEDAGFNSDITLSAPDLPAGMTATFDPTTFLAPGDGVSKVTLTVDATTFPQTYRGLGLLGTGGSETNHTSIGVDVVCDPPFITAGANPKSQTVVSGSTATLSVRPERAGVFTYQWYNGHAGFTRTPMPNSNSAAWTTPAINSVQEYWVRVTNACGTADSTTATITPR